LQPPAPITIGYRCDRKVGHLWAPIHAPVDNTGSMPKELTYAKATEPSAAHPLVSVVMAVRDGAATVRQSIDSILDQSLDDLELIVIDDGSTDRTVDEVAAVADRRIRLVSLPSPRGRSEATNEAILRSRARYVAIADADDISLPHRVERQVAFLNTHDQVSVLGGQIRHFGAWGGPVLLTEFPTDPDAILARFGRGHMALAHPTAMFRRSVFDEVGLYFSECFRAQDLQLLLRTCGFGVIAALPDVLVHYRTDRRLPSWSYWRKSADYRRYAVYSAARHRMGLVAENYSLFSSQMCVRATRWLDPLRYVRGMVPHYLGSRERLE
jgi:glycosyltransferase involved in cell wall biosynthesis